MSPKHFKQIRESFDLTQEEFATCFGLTQKTISQYEIGFRETGPTVRVLALTLEELPKEQAKKLLERMKRISEGLASKKSRGSR